MPSCKDTVNQDFSLSVFTGGRVSLVEDVNGNQWRAAIRRGSWPCFSVGKFPLAQVKSSRTSSADTKANGTLQFRTGSCVQLVQRMESLLSGVAAWSRGDLAFQNCFTGISSVPSGRLLCYDFVLPAHLLWRLQAIPPAPQGIWSPLSTVSGPTSSLPHEIWGIGTHNGWRHGQSRKWWTSVQVTLGEVNSPQPFSKRRTEVIYWKLQHRGISVLQSSRRRSLFLASFQKILVLPDIFNIH